MIEVTVQLPDDIAEQFGGAPGEIPRHVLEAVAVEGYRSAKLSREQVGELLHLDFRQTHDFLAEHGVEPAQLESLDAAESDPDWEAFRRALPQLLETHRGKFVAMANGRIIDSDPDDLALVERVVKQYPNLRVLIQPVVEGGMQEFHIDTPECEFIEARGT